MNQNLKYGGVLLLSGAATLPSAHAKPAASSEDKRPNVVIIFTDDQGYADLGCFGSTTNKTPVMDQLHSEGTSFSNFYAQPVSGSSRSALMTGRYPIRSGGRSMPASEVTIAEMAQQAGYETACIGKWDISGRKAIIEQMPNAQGFDYYFGTLGGNDSGTIDLYENNNYVRTTSDMSSLLRMYTEKSINFLCSRDEEKPFFLYLAHTMMHVVIDASKDFKGKSAGGLYGDVVEEFDYETGRLLDALEQLGVSDNTIIIYATDNGPWCQRKYTQRPSASGKYPEGTTFWGDVGGLRGGKGSAYEGGSRVQCIMKWKDMIPEGRTCDGLMATLDFMPTFANWMGYTIPEEIRMDGVDQSKMILGRTKKSARSTYCYGQHHEGLEKFCAIRNDRWKLLLPNREINTIYLMDFGTNDFELYDLKKDIGETKNIVKKKKKIVKQLRSEIIKNY
ncbi:MAG: sulfatase-like hydrolase/transferase [Rikenellaceae bacterium]